MVINMFDDGDCVVFSGTLADIEPGWDDEVYEEILDPHIPKNIYYIDNFQMTCSLELPCGTEVECSLHHVQEFD